jgi:hypothetical protein
VYRRELNEARGILAGSSIVKTTSSSPEEAILDPLACGEGSGAIHGVYPTGSLALACASLR